MSIEPENPLAVLQAQIENYLMNRLSAEERRDFEAKMNADQDLQAAVRNEKEVIAAIRSVGRVELKAELKRQLAERRAPQRDGFAWMKIAAAMLVLMISLGGYFLLQEGDTRETTMAAAESPAADKLAEAEDQFRAMADRDETLPEALEAVSESARVPEGEALAENDAVSAAARTSRTTPQPEITAAAPPPSPGLGGMQAAGAGKAAVPQMALAEDRADRQASGEIAEMGDEVASGFAAANEKPAFATVAPAGGDWYGEHQFALGDHKIAVTISARPDSPAREKSLQADGEKKETGLLDRKALQSRQRSAAPDSQGSAFPVEVRREETGQLALKWFVLPGELGGKPEQAVLKMIGEQLLEVTLGDGAVYRIDLSKPQTTAVRMR